MVFACFRTEPSHEHWRGDLSCTRGYETWLITQAKALDMAIAGETYEYTEMYPQFRHLAEQEGNSAAVKEMDEQIEEEADSEDPRWLDPNIMNNEMMAAQMERWTI